MSGGLEPPGAGLPVLSLSHNTSAWIRLNFHHFQWNSISCWDQQHSCAPPHARKFMGISGVFGQFWEGNRVGGHHMSSSLFSITPISGTRCRSHLLFGEGCQRTLACQLCPLTDFPFVPASSCFRVPAPVSGVSAAINRLFGWWSRPWDSETGGGPGSLSLLVYHLRLTAACCQNLLWSLSTVSQLEQLLFFNNSSMWIDLQTLLLHLALNRGFASLTYWGLYLKKGVRGCIIRMVGLQWEAKWAEPL